MRNWYIRVRDLSSLCTVLSAQSIVRDTVKKYSSVRREVPLRNKQYLKPKLETWLELLESNTEREDPSYQSHSCRECDLKIGWAPALLGVSSCIKGWPKISSALRWEDSKQGSRSENTTVTKCFLRSRLEDKLFVLYIYCHLNCLSMFNTSTHFAIPRKSSYPLKA